jgi:hypothetical protein
MYPVTPNRKVSRATARAWFEGRTGALRQRPPFADEAVAEMAQEIAAGLPGSGITPEAAEEMLKTAIARREPAGGDSDGAD